MDLAVNVHPRQNEFQKSKSSSSTSRVFEFVNGPRARSFFFKLLHGFVLMHYKAGPDDGSCGGDICPLSFSFKTDFGGAGEDEALA